MRHQKVSQCSPVLLKKVSLLPRNLSCTLLLLQFFSPLISHTCMCGRHCLCNLKDGIKFNEHFLNTFIPAGIFGGVSMQNTSDKNPDISLSWKLHSGMEFTDSLSCRVCLECVRSLFWSSKCSCSFLRPLGDIQAGQPRQSCSESCGYR